MFGAFQASQRSDSHDYDSDDSDSTGSACQRMTVERSENNDMFASAPYVYNLWKARCKAAGKPEMSLTYGASAIFCDFQRRVTESLISEMDCSNRTAGRQVFRPDTVIQASHMIFGHTPALRPQGEPSESKDDVLPPEKKGTVHDIVKQTVNSVLSTYKTEYDTYVRETLPAEKEARRKKYRRKSKETK